MNKMKTLLNLFLALFPTKLPQGMSEFDTWADSLIAIANFPTSDSDSIKYALATMIMHTGSTTAYKPKMYFIMAIKAGAAKQVASGVFQQIKHRQAEAQKKAAEAANVQSV